MQVMRRVFLQVPTKLPGFRNKNTLKYLRMTVHRDKVKFVDEFIEEFIDDKFVDEFVDEFVNKFLHDSAMNL